MKFLVVLALWMRFNGRHLAKTSSSEMDGPVLEQHVGKRRTKMNCTWRL